MYFIELIPLNLNIMWYYIEYQFEVQIDSKSL